MNLRLWTISLVALLFLVCAFIFGRARRATHVSYNVQGRLLIEEGKYREAAAALENAVKLDPSYADAHHHLGIAYGKLGRLDDAERSLRNAILRGGDLAEVRFNLGTVLEARGEYRAAIEAYEQAEGLKTDYRRARKARARVHCAMGKEALYAGRLDEGERMLRAALDIDQDSVEAHYALAKLRMREGKLGEAIDRFTLITNLAPGIEMKPVLVQAYRNVAEMQERLQRHREAADAYRRSLALAPDDARARHALGAALIRLGEYREGAEEIRKARRADPAIPADEPLARELAEQATELTAEGAFAEAHERLEAAAAVDPATDLSAETAGLLYAEGVAHEERGETGRAIECYRKAEELDPRIDGLDLRLARLLGKHGPPGDAIPRYEALRVRDPNNPEWSRLLGELYLSAGEHEKALAAFEALGDEGRERSRDVLVAWAAAAAGKGNLDAAIPLYRRALALDPADDTLRTELCLALSRRGLHEEAVVGMKEILTRKPAPEIPRILQLAWHEHRGSVRRIEDACIVEGKDGLEGRHTWEFVQRHMQKPEEILLGALTVQAGKEHFAPGKAFPPDHPALMRIRYLGPDSQNSPVTLLLTHDGGAQIRVFLPILRPYQEVYPDINGFTYYGYYGGRLQEPARVLFPGGIPHELGFHYAMGIILRNAGARDEAAGFASLITDAGRAYDLMGHLDTAETCLRWAVEIDPSSYKAQLCLGETLFYRGKLREALEPTRKAAALLPSSPTPINNLGAIYMKMGSKYAPLAEASLLRAIELHDGYHTPCHNLTVLYERIGDTRQARFWRDRQGKVAGLYIKDDGLMVVEPGRR